jgi:hypothetical protein
MPGCTTQLTIHSKKEKSKDAVINPFYRPPGGIFFSDFCFQNLIALPDINKTRPRIFGYR